MEKVEERFEQAIQGASGGLLNSPGHEGMVIFFSGLGYTFDVQDIHTVFSQNGWASSRSLTLDDVRQIAKDLELFEETDVAEVQTMEIAKLIDTIAQCLNEKTFPTVLPEECLAAENVCIEASPYTLASKMETVEIQTYLDSQWQAYQELNPDDEDFPVQVKKARWARENYYYLLQAFLQRRTLDSNTFAHRK